MIRAASPITLDPGPDLAGRRVVVVEDGPTVTHGGMAHGAGLVAARHAGAIVVDPRPWAVGCIADAYEQYPHLGPVVPAMGYGEDQVADLSRKCSGRRLRRRGDRDTDRSRKNRRPRPPQPTRPLHRAGSRQARSRGAPGATDRAVARDEASLRRHRKPGAVDVELIATCAPSHQGRRFWMEWTFRVPDVGSVIADSHGVPAGVTNGRRARDASSGACG